MRRLGCELTLLATLATLIAGCSEASMDAAGEFNGVPTATSGEADAAQVRIDIFPGQLVDANGNLRTLPQTVGPFDRFGTSLDVGVVELSRPGTLSGVVTGSLPAPWADGAQIPNESGPVVNAEVLIERARTVQTYVDSTEEDGFYDAFVVPSEAPYTVAVIPDDPSIPFGVDEVKFRDTDEVLDFELGFGVSLYGRVLTGASEPVQGARVQAVDPSGIASTYAYTDSAGWYELRVFPDVEYTVVCAGRDHGRDPSLTSPPVLADQDLGARVDFDYPNLSGSFAAGRAVVPGGTALSGVTVRFTAVDLQGYDALPPGFSAGLVVQDTSDTNGSFEATLIDGSYIVEFLPPDASDPELEHAPVAFSFDSDTGSLGDVELPALDLVSGSTASDARIVCTEAGFGGRNWSTFANRHGNWEMLLPATELSCQVQPPAELSGSLAWTNTTIAPGPVNGFEFALPVRSGALISGVVQVSGAAESFALVEVRDGLGRLLGSTITGSDLDEDAPAGTFDLRVDLPDDEP